MYPAATTTYALTTTHFRSRVSDEVTVAIAEPDPSDVFEPNDTRAEAMPIAATVKRPLLWFVQGDVDWFAFELTWATELYARVSSWDHDDPYIEDPTDTRLLLFGACGGPVEDTYGDEWRNGPLLHAILPAGSYRLAVAGLDDEYASGNHTQMGHYVLLTIAEQAPPSDACEPNDMPLAAHPIALDCVAEVLTITPRDVDRFSVTLTAPKTVSAKAVVTEYGDDWFEAILALLDEDLEGVDVGWRRVGAYLPAGTHYLGVAPHTDPDMTGAHWRTGAYRLEVVATNPPTRDAA